MEGRDRKRRGQHRWADRPAPRLFVFSLPIHLGHKRWIFCFLADLTSSSAWNWRIYGRKMAINPNLTKFLSHTRFFCLPRYSFAEMKFLSIEVSIEESFSMEKYNYRPVLQWNCPLIIDYGFGIGHMLYRALFTLYRSSWGKGTFVIVLTDWLEGSGFESRQTLIMAQGIRV